MCGARVIKQGMAVREHGQHKYLLQFPKRVKRETTETMQIVVDLRPLYGRTHH